MRELLRRLKYFWHRCRNGDDLAEEMAFHREMVERDLRVRGAHGADARVEATRALGNELSARARARDEWIAPWIQEVMQDVRFAARLLMRDRAFATTVVVVLGLGIGVNNIFFTVAYAHTLRGLPIDRAERVVHISTLDDRGTDRPLSLSTFAELQRSGLRFTAIAAFHNAPLILGDERRAPDRVDGAYVSARAFGLLGVKSIVGRSFTADDDRAGAPMVVMLGNAAWQSRYGGESAVVGRSILVNGLPASVIGIVPDRSGFPSTAAAWLPLAHVAETTSNAPTVQVFGRVRDEVDLVDARSEIEAIIERALQQSAAPGPGVRARVVPINQRYFGRLEGPWLAFLSASLLIVAIAAANVANLMLGRAAGRSREMAVRTSLGASRLRIGRQLLIEGSVLAALGGGAGLAIAFVGIRLFKAAVPEALLPYWFDYHFDSRTVAALVGVSLSTLLVFALAPALHGSKADVNLVLKDSGKTSIGRRTTAWWTSAFLAAELALTVVLLANLILGLRLGGPELPSDTVIETQDILTAAITLPAGSIRPPRSARSCTSVLKSVCESCPGCRLQRSRPRCPDEAPQSGCSIWRDAHSTATNLRQGCGPWR
ncbi:MAG: ABC transporter permease [Vicinamibacterales bacterium]